LFLAPRGRPAPVRLPPFGIDFPLMKYQKALDCIRTSNCDTDNIVVEHIAGGSVLIFSATALR
jgi:hypothetical protein